MAPFDFSAPLSSVEPASLSAPPLPAGDEIAAEGFWNYVNRERQAITAMLTKVPNEPALERVWHALTYFSDPTYLLHRWVLFELWQEEEVLPASDYARLRAAYEPSMFSLDSSDCVMN